MKLSSVRFFAVMCIALLSFTCFSQSAFAQGEQFVNPGSETIGGESSASFCGTFYFLGYGGTPVEAAIEAQHQLDLFDHGLENPAVQVPLNTRSGAATRPRM